MSTLQQVMQEVPALRDRLDVETLNAVGASCRDLNDSVRQSDAYRQRYLADNYVSLRLGAAVAQPPHLREPEADFKKVAYGQRVFVRRLQERYTPTPADLSAETYYLSIVRPGAQRTIDRLRRIPAGEAVIPPSDPARTARIKRQCTVAAAVLVGAGVALGLFLYGTTLAAIVVLGALCAAFMHWGRPLLDWPQG